MSGETKTHVKKHNEGLEANYSIGTLHKILRELELMRRKDELALVKRIAERKNMICTKLIGILTRMLNFQITRTYSTTKLDVLHEDLNEPTYVRNVRIVMVKADEEYRLGLAHRKSTFQTLF